MPLVDLFKTFRPVHWIKNLLVLAPLFFSGEAFPFRFSELGRELTAFAGFCFAASLIYVVNDLNDVEQDRRDAAKRLRPYAAGRISKSGMAAAAAALAACAVICCARLGAAYSCAVAVYVFVMLLYSASLKRFAMLGAAIISGGMIVRILAGAVAIGVKVSVWVYPSAFLLAFYVVAGKRFYSETGRAGGKSTRVEDAVFLASGAATFIVYIIYCLSGVGPEKYHTNHLWVTAPFVGVAIWRYAQVARRSFAGHEHLQAILSDATIVASVLIWLAVFTMLIYV